MKLDTDSIKQICKDYQRKNNWELTEENFIWSAKRYIKAIKERRMITVIYSVSNSGMSRNMGFFEMDKNKTLNESQLLNFQMLFRALGYKLARNNNEGFTISGCGMDMVFNTNYNIIHQLHHLGLINKAKCEKLAQKTPHVL